MEPSNNQHIREIYVVLYRFKKCSLLKDLITHVFYNQNVLGRNDVYL